MDFTEWTPKEDEFLNNFMQNRQQVSWQEISLKMSKFLELLRKTGKQCQQRFQLINAIETCSKVDWNQEQQQILVKKHRQMGNKWAAISQYLDRKSDNCVKNHFYSRLRKMVRKLNRIVQIHLKKSFRAIPNSTIYKLVQASQQRFKQKPICSHEVSIASQDVIQKMLRTQIQAQSGLGDTSYASKSQLDQFRTLIQQMINANKNYRKKSKKIKNSTIKAPVRMAKGLKSASNDQQMEQEYKADQSLNQPDSQLLNFTCHLENQPRFLDDVGTEQFDKSAPVRGGVGKNVQIKEGDQMERLLKNIGLLHQRKKSNNIQDGTSQKGSKSIRSYSDFQIPSQDLSFFDDSNNCWKKQTQMFSRMNKKLFGDNSSQIQGL